MIDKEDIQDLQRRSDVLADKLSTIDGRLQGTLPHLATKADLGEAVTGAVKEHVQIRHVGIDKKKWGALIGALTILVTALSALANKLIETL